MRILVFGATGRTGRLLVRTAVERGHEVTAFVREGTDLGPMVGARVASGDPCDPATLSKTFADTDPEAVLSAIGPVVGRAGTEVSEVAAAIVDAMAAAGPVRLVIASNVTVFTDEEVTGRYAGVSAEHRRTLAIVRGSTLDWTALAPALLRDDDGSGSFVAKVGGPAPGPSIARADFAVALLEALERPDWIDRAVGVSS